MKDPFTINGKINDFDKVMALLTEGQANA